MPPVKPKVLFLFGPTASGKSTLALKLAKALNGCIINADSRQIYREIPILTACPSAANYKAIPHQLYEFLPLTQRFSAAEYATLATQVIEKALQQGQTPLVVGGTGFYMKALLGGLSLIPATNSDIEAEVQAMPFLARYEALQRVDPTTAVRLHPNDTQRVVRALSVWRQTGKPLSVWQQGRGTAKHAWGILKVGLAPPRAVVHNNIATRRTLAMPQHGLRRELEALIDKGYTGLEPGLHGLANGLLLQHIRTGQPEWQEVTQKAIEADRQYAKRQYTWLKNSYGADLILTAPDVPTVLAALAA